MTVILQLSVENIGTYLIYFKICYLPLFTSIVVNQMIRIMVTLSTLSRALKQVILLESLLPFKGSECGSANLANITACTKARHTAAVAHTNNSSI